MKEKGKKVKLTADVDEDLKQKAKIKAVKEKSNLSRKVEELLFKYVNS